MYEIEFLGACGTVTGSRYLLKIRDRNILVDCGLFQGNRETKQLNWEDFPLPPHHIHGVILTHAHVDHSGFLPRLHKMGFEGPIWATPGTSALLSIMLPDSGQLVEGFQKALKETRGWASTPPQPRETFRP